MSRARPDLTEGPIGRTLLIFALPTLASNVLQSFNGSINAVWVGRFLGEAALAATSNANLVMFLMFAAIFGFGMTATIMIGQSFGARDIDGARRAFGSAIGLFIVVSLATAILGWLVAPALLHLLGTPAEVFPLALAYLRVMFLGFPPSCLTVLMMTSLRGAGDSLTPLWFMIVAAVIDISFNPVLILGLGPAPQMGIAGAATATLIANLVGLGSMIAYVYARDLPLRLRGREWRYLVPRMALLRPMLVKGIPMSLQMLVMSTSALALIGLVNREGTTTVAAYGAANQIWTYIQMPPFAIGAAVSAMAAQNIGAGRWDRIARITRAGVVVNGLLTGGLVLLAMLLDRHVLGLFLGADSGAIEIGARINLLASWGFILFGVTMVLSAITRANGAAIAPLVILVIAMFPVRLGLAFAFHPRFGADAIWLSVPAGTIASTLMTLGYYRYGGWRTLKPMLAPTLRTAREEALQSETEPTARNHPAA